MTEPGARDWRDDAACKDAPSAWFYVPELPAKHQEQRDRIAIAKAITRFEAAGLPAEVGERLFALHQEQRDPYTRARVVCGACAVRRECLAYAFAVDAVGGIWGGYDDEQRRKIRRQRAKAARADRAAVETELAS